MELTKEDILVREASHIIADLHFIKSYYLIYRYVAKLPVGLVEFDGIMVPDNGGVIIGIEAKYKEGQGFDKLVRQCVYRRKYFNYMYGVTSSVSLYRLLKNMADIIINGIGIIEYNIDSGRHIVFFISRRREPDINILDEQYLYRVGYWEHIVR